MSKAAATGGKALKVRDFVVTDEFALIGEEATVKEGIRKLLDMRRGVLLVTAMGKPKDVKGVVTERKILSKLAEDVQVGSTLGKIMDSHVLHVSVEDDLKTALAKINQEKPAAVIVDGKNGEFKGYFSPIDYLEAEKRILEMESAGTE